MKHFNESDIRNVKITDKIFSHGIMANHESTIPSSIRRCYETGRIDAFKLEWKEGMENKPHIFWDSDVAKVLEGMAYALMLRPDVELEKELDELVDLIISAQQPDGYLNSHFTVTETENRWKYLHWAHELYCAGHLMEAAVAHFRLTGKRKFLDCMCRYADYIASVFGCEEGQIRGYPGHEEIELALCRLAEASGNKKYYNLAKFFVDERGQNPNYFVEKEDVQVNTLINLQAHKPVREQTEAVGHAVRAVYLYSGMADVAAETNDVELLSVCEKLFENIRNKRMYITGGIGSTRHSEAFEADYILPNDTAYAESCAAIGLIFFARRMMNITGQGKYADVMERSLYNGALSGISLAGDEFFYVNPLEINENSKDSGHIARERQKWFGCSCCPTNYCRFLPQIASFIWSENQTELRLNIPVASEYAGKVIVSGAYPYDGKIEITFTSRAEYAFSVRIPSWCKNFELMFNGKKLEENLKDGYITLRRTWERGDVLSLNLDMPVRIIRANRMLVSDAGKLAIMRGPLVYALESIDNKSPLSSLMISRKQDFKLITPDGLPSETVAVSGDAYYEAVADDELYSDNETNLEKCTFTAIPYALWQNRGESNMSVWIREYF